MYKIGINDTHNSSIAIFDENKIIFVSEEERFSRCKQISGFPFYAAKYALKKFKIKPNQIESVSFATKKITGMNIWNVASDFSIENWYDLQEKFFYPKIYKNKKVKLKKIFKSFKPSKNVHYSLKKIPLLSSGEMSNRDYQSIKNIRIKFASNFFQISEDKINFFDHHTCSAYYGYFSNYENFKKRTAVVTLDSGGDDKYNTIRIFDKKKIYLVKQKSKSLIGQIYDSVTLILGMNPSRHQYKLMGLAPYAIDYHKSKTRNILLKCLKIVGINFKKEKKVKDYFFYLKEKFKYERFDGIAGGVQDFVEISLTKWFKNINKKFKIKNFVFVGGVANNVKANKKLIDQKFVERLFVPAGPGDENLSIGAIYCNTVKNLGYLQAKNIFNYENSNVYWGNDISLEELKNFKNNNLVKKYYSFVHDPDFKKTSKILSKNKIVLMCFGKMEFGNRALGHRSILCNPSNLNLVQEINRKFKKRDFWMPFAASILSEDEKKYLINKKNIEANFMTLSFDSLPKGQKKIIAGMHQYDKTIRPQIVSKKTCPRYYQLIKKFKKITGVGGLLNTSLNVHDKPIVCRPIDIINEFFVSKNAIKNIEYIYVKDSLFKIKKS